MIPDIGLMIAAYTITRLTAMLGQPTSQTNVIAKISAVAAVVATCIAMFDLIGKSASFPMPG